jgi:hypothetical protein
MDMNKATLTTLLQVAGLLHLGLLWAGASMPRVVNLRAHLSMLPVFIRRLFLVYFAFIGLILIGFGSLSYFFAGSIAGGEPLGRALAVLMTAFWGVRLVVATFVFDAKPYLTSGWYRLGYHAINLVFVYLLGIYALAVWGART